MRVGPVTGRAPAVKEKTRGQADTWTWGPRRYYARLVVAATEGVQKSARRIPLENAHTPAEAKVALEDLKKERRDECLRPVKQAPYFDEFAEVYLSLGKGGKPLSSANAQVSNTGAISSVALA